MTDPGQTSPSGGRPEGPDRTSDAAAPLAEATLYLLDWAEGEAPWRAALESRLLDALEDAGGCAQATIWVASPQARGGGAAGPRAWTPSRSRGPLAPPPGALPHPGFRAVDAGPLGTVVHATEAFDGGAREAREDVIEALVILAGELLGATGAGRRDAPPGPLPGGGPPRDAA